VRTEWLANMKANNVTECSSRKSVEEDADDNDDDADDEVCHSSNDMTMNVKIVPRMLIDSKDLIDSSAKIKELVKLLLELKNKYDFDGYVVECGLEMWKGLLEILK
jgi:hypothetical protein